MRWAVKGKSGVKHVCVYAVIKKKTNPITFLMPHFQSIVRKIIWYHLHIHNMCINITLIEVFSITKNERRSKVQKNALEMFMKRKTISDFSTTTIAMPIWWAFLPCVCFACRTTARPETYLHKKPRYGPRNASVLGGRTVDTWSVRSPRYTHFIFPETLNKRHIHPHLL